MKIEIYDPRMIIALFVGIVIINFFNEKRKIKKIIKVIKKVIKVIRKMIKVIKKVFFKK